MTILQIVLIVIGLGGLILTGVSLIAMQRGARAARRDRAAGRACNDRIYCRGVQSGFFSNTKLERDKNVRNHSRVVETESGIVEAHICAGNAGGEARRCEMTAAELKTAVTAIKASRTDYTITTNKDNVKELP